MRENLAYGVIIMSHKITINDIAKLAKVSKTTVSFYLNGKFDKMSLETKNRIAQAIEKTEYQPSIVARSLNSKRTRLIGVIIGDITNSFANQIVKGIEDYAKENEYQLIVGSSNYEIKNEKRHVSSMLAMGVDGFIVQPTVDFEEMWLSTKTNEKPIAYFDSPNRGMQGLWVKTNNYEAVYDACDILIEKGYEEFVLVTAKPQVLTTRLERYQGFIDCVELKQVKYHVIIANNDTSIEELNQKLNSVITKEKRVCVFVCNNWLLTKVYMALKEVGHLIPQRLGLIGFDSLEWSELASPSITTIVQPAYEEGYKAGKILIDRIENRNQEVPNQILKCRLNECDSTNLKLEK